MREDMLKWIRAAHSQPLRSPDEERVNGRWSSIEVQQGLTLEQQNWLDDLAHGLVPKGALDWICDLIEQRGSLAARSLDEERAEFEAKMREIYNYDDFALRKLEDGTYIDSNLRLLWKVWLAARGVTQEGE